MVKGICAEELMPYNPNCYNIGPSAEAIEDAEACRVLEAKNVNPTLKDIKSALADGHPVVIVSRIFNSFSDTRKGFVRHPSKEEVADGAQPEKHGNHAMVVCGFSDKQRVLVVRNSWGEEFGEGGYCYIPYTYAEKYFLQACIITSMSVDPQKRVDLSKKTLDFNLSDSRIEAAILINLIDEDKVTMDDLKSKYDSMQLDWYKNIVTLGNVNNQSELIKKAKDQIDETIEEKMLKSAFYNLRSAGNCMISKW